MINFEKIGPDPPPPQFDKEDGKDEMGKDGENGEDKILPNTPANMSWHNCRKMIYVPKTSKAFCVGKI